VQQSGSIIRGLATADLHLGIDNVGGLNAYGLPARVDDFFSAFDQMIGFARGRRGATGGFDAEPVDLFIIAGDLTRHRNPPQRIVAPFLYRVRAMVDKGITVVLVCGNHDGQSGRGQYNLLDAAAEVGGASADGGQVIIFNEPASLTASTRHGKVRLVGIPWPRVGASDGAPMAEVRDAADAVLRDRIGQAALPESLDYAEPEVMIGHLAVAGADRASDQWMTLGYEPLVRPGDFPPTLDLVLLGHYHKPSIISRSGPPILYCGSPITIDFGEEGQEKMAWRFALDGSRPRGQRCVELTSMPLAGRPFRTIDLDLADFIDPVVVTAAAIEAIHQSVGDVLDGAVVRVRIKCRAAAQAGALKLGAIDAALREAGAWYVAGIHVEAPRAERRWGGDSLMSRPPEELLREYLERTEPDPDRRARLYGLAMQLKAEAEC